MEWTECVERVGKREPVSVSLGTSTIECDMILAAQKRYVPKTNQNIRQVILNDNGAEIIASPRQITLKKKD